jgi:hypothetical protein
MKQGIKQAVKGHDNASQAGQQLVNSCIAVNVIYQPSIAAHCTFQNGTLTAPAAARQYRVLRPAAAA